MGRGSGAATLMLVRKKQAILKALAIARGNTKFLERCRLSAEVREMQRQVKNAVRCERGAATEALAEKAEMAAAKGDTRELFRLTRKMAPPQRPHHSDSTIVLSQNRCLG